MTSSAPTETVHYAHPQIGRPPTAAERWFYAFVRGTIHAFCRLFWRIEIHGADNVPDEGPFVLSGVHRSNIDTPLVAAITRRRLRYMGKDTMWKYRMPAWFFTALGGFPVHRGKADREALRTGQAVLEQGEPLVVFPEGQRRAGPVVEDLFDGAAMVASRTGAPIVPVGIGGAAEAMPIGSGWLRPVKIVMVVGEPIHPEPVEDGRRPSRRDIKAMTAELQERLQKLFDEAKGLGGYH